VRDPVHAGDKALTRETPVKRGGLTGMGDCVCGCSIFF
jgi:hypothetical protein